LIQAQDNYADSSVEVAAPEVEEETAETVQKITIPQSFIYRQVPEATVDSLQKRKDFAYANDPEYWIEKPEQQRETRSQKNSKGFWSYFNDFFSGKTIRTLTYGILIAFFLFVIYRIIVVNKLFLFYSAKKAKPTDTGEGVDIDDDNLDEKIQKAVADKDHRMAVRFMYLKALRLLNDRQWIRYHADATNYEYVQQMSGHRLSKDFGFLTRVYDYMWYGEFSLNAEQFDIVYKNFSHFYNTVNP
jgi:hypothetical protein